MAWLSADARKESLVSNASWTANMSNNAGHEEFFLGTRPASAGTIAFTEAREDGDLDFERDRESLVRASPRGALLYPDGGYDTCIELV